MSYLKTKKKNKIKGNDDNAINTKIKNKIMNYSYTKSPLSSDSSLFENINFSELFNPNDKYINFGDKTSFDLSSYNLGIFNSISTICKNLNISYEKIFNKCLDTSNKLNLIKNNENNNDENIINESNNKENIFTDSIIKMLLSEENTAKTKKDKNKIKKSTIKKLNSSGISLNENEIDELLKDYFPMELEKNN